MPHQSYSSDSFLDSADTILKLGAGYGSAEYAASFLELGYPIALPRCGGWLLRRSIPGHNEEDATGLYPLFGCQNWNRLGDDIENLRDRFVSVTLVTDPFGDYTENTLHNIFPDLCVAYKEHYFINLDRYTARAISSHHRRNARVGLRSLTIEFCDDPAEYLGDWTQLYRVLVARHKIRGIADFSHTSFAAQFRVPGLVLQRAVHNGLSVGMVMWLVNGPVLHYHLGAYNERGYDLRASYALFWTAIEHFRNKVEFIALGSVPDQEIRQPGGLARFKAGWATGTHPAYLCGRVFSPATYTALTAANGSAGAHYFPAYRYRKCR